jgi:aspartate aminotransferase
MEWKEYPYYDPSIKGVNIVTMLQTIEEAPNASIIMLHSCAHNPTGADPSFEEWVQISEVAKRKGHLCFFDNAYQGFASGDADVDARPIRHFLANGNLIVGAQSFAKNFGLYGERIGNFTVVCEDKAEAGRVMSQIKILARPIYSNPPLFGARIVSTILNTPELTI